MITYIKPYKLNNVMIALRKHGVEEVFIEEVKQYPAEKDIHGFLPRYKLKLCLEEDHIDKVREIITQECVSLDENDEDYVISDLIETYDIHTGEKNVVINQVDSP